MERRRPSKARDSRNTMERDSGSGEKDRFRSERDSWSEEIDPLRSDNGRHSWSGVEQFWRESLQTFETDAYPGEEDDIKRPNKRDSQVIKGQIVVERCPSRRQGLVIQNEHTLEYKRDSLSIERAFPLKGAYERDCQPVNSYDRLSVARAHTMKDFEKQITELKKENFNLKLRIYFLEEQMQRRCDNSSEELHRMNIELKVEVESLKHDFQEKQTLLIRASKAMESLAGQHSLAVQQLKDEHVRQLQALEESHQQRVQEGKQETVCVLLQQEQIQRYSAEERLLAVKEQYAKSMGILEERNWIIQCLNETLRSKDSLIAQLEKQINAMMPIHTSRGKAGSGLYPELDAEEGCSGSPGLACPECLASKAPEEKEEWQKKVKEMGNLIKELQEKLEDNKAGLVAGEKNTLKRDKAIQGLTLALKTKTKENQKLQKDIDNLNATLAKVRESAHQGQNSQESGHPDYKKLIATIQAQQDLCLRLRQYERESGSLQKELDAILMLRQWLEKDIQANEELRRVLEAQIMAKYRESDTLSFLGDQTSYLSICLNNLGQNTDCYDDVTRPLVKSVETQTMVEDPVPAEEPLHGLSCQQEGLLHPSVTELATAKEEKTSSIAMHAKPAHHSQNAVSSSTQTQLKYFSDKGVLVDIFTFEKQAPEDEGPSIESENRPFTAAAGGANRPLHPNKQQKCLSNTLTKSRIPVLIKSSLSTRLKAEAFLTSQGGSHVCLQNELQEENCRLYDQLKSAELEIEALKSNQGSPADASQDEEYCDGVWTDSSGKNLRTGTQSKHGGLSDWCAEMKVDMLQPDRGHLKHVSSPAAKEEQDEEYCEGAWTDSSGKNPQPGTQSKHGGLSDWCADVKVDVLQPGRGHLKHISSPAPKEELDEGRKETFQQALYEELQAEKDRLSQQLQGAQMEIERLQSQMERMNAEYADVSEPSLQKLLQMENLRLAEQVKHAETLQASRHTLHMGLVCDVSSADTQEGSMAEQALQIENRLRQQLEHAPMDIKTPLAKRCATAESDVTEPSLQEMLTPQLKSAQMDSERLRAEGSTLENLTAPYDLDGVNTADIDMTGQSLRKELQVENFGLTKEGNHVQMDIEELRRCPLENLSVGTALNGAKTAGNDVTGQSLQNELWVENLGLFEQLQDAWRGTEKLQDRGSSVSGFHRDVTMLEQPLVKELTLQNRTLSERLKKAQVDMESLQARVCTLAGVSSIADLDAIAAESGVPDTTLQNEIVENLSFAKQLRQAQMDIEGSRARECIMGNLTTASGLGSATENEETGAMPQKEIVKNLCLAEQLRQAQMDIESLKARQCIMGNLAAASGLGGAAESEGTGPAPQELPVVENLSLAKQLRQAQMDIESLMAQECIMGNLGPASGLGGATEREGNGHTPQELSAVGDLRPADLTRAQIDVEQVTVHEHTLGHVSAPSNLDTTKRDLPGQSLRLENHRLSEQLKCAQVEIKKLEEEKLLLEELSSHFQLEEPDSELSFMDKTITNSVNLSEAPNADSEFHSPNVARLQCHHDEYCVECANSQETLILQSFREVATVQKECKLLRVSHGAFEDPSLSQYDLLVQSQARELSYQRQKIKESHNLSAVCSQNFINVLKAFEELFPTTILDSNVALVFREQLAQSVEWLKDLEYKLSDAYYGEEDANSDHSADSLSYTPSRLVPGHRMWADKRGGHVLGLVEDYNALRKQILEAKAVLQEMDAFVGRGLQTAALDMTEHFANVFFQKLGRTKQSLEEASCLLKLLWRVSLPLQSHNSIRQVEETNLEITRLRNRVVEQEKLLSGMVKRVYSGNQMKEDIEKLIMDQLAMTHEILKRAKGNLEVQVVASK